MCWLNQTKSLLGFMLTKIHKLPEGLHAIKIHKSPIEKCHVNMISKCSTFCTAVTNCTTFCTDSGQLIRNHQKGRYVGWKTCSSEHAAKELDITTLEMDINNSHIRYQLLIKRFQLFYESVLLTSRLNVTNPIWAFATSSLAEFNSQEWALISKWHLTCPTANS